MLKEMLTEISNNSPMNTSYFKTCSIDEHNYFGLTLIYTNETFFLLPSFIYFFILLTIHLALYDIFRGYNPNI